MGGPPCVIIETFGDEAIIKSIADFVSFDGRTTTPAGTEFCVAKRDLMQAEVLFVERPSPIIQPNDPDWNLIIGRGREYSK
jgi:hypothetical protein